MSGSDDEAWFTELVRAHQVALRDYVSRRVTPADVDDVVAEVLAAAWRHRDSRPPMPELWLYRTAWNSLLHQFRSQRRRERLTARLSQMPTAAPGGDTAAADSEAADVVRSCLARLTDADQELIRLTYWERLTTAEAAYILGGSPAAVRVRLHRARRRLAELLPEWLDPPDARTAQSAGCRLDAAATTSGASS
jgi:RNA polymerase sigma-70 factor (ECF subfamily)